MLGDGIRRLLLCAFASLCMVAVAIIPPLSKNANGAYDYSPASTVMLAECLKLAIATVLHSHDCRVQATPPFEKVSLKELLLYAVPSMLYFTTNNLALIIVTAITPISFQLISQVKTVVTGVLFSTVLSRPLSAHQWLALVILGCATASAIDGSSGVRSVAGPASTNCTPSDTGDADCPGMAYALPWTVGVALTLVSTILSSTAGVFNELLLKHRSSPLHLQNMQMYAWGIGFNLAYMLVVDGKLILQHGLLAGYNVFTVLVILAQAINGLAISFVLKYVDNIARVFAAAASLVIILVLSCILFNTVFSASLLIAILLVFVATLQYSVAGEQLEALLERTQAAFWPTFCVSCTWLRTLIAYSKSGDGGSMPGAKDGERKNLMRA